MITFNLYDNNIDNDLIIRILEKYKESKNELKRKTNILNFIIYNNGVDQKFNMSDKEILLKRYYFLDYIWEYKGITCPLITLLLTGMNYVKQKKELLKHLK